MPCKHTEDVCQHCLEKVQTSTEQEQEVSSWRPRWVPKKTSAEKANEIFMATSSLVLAGYVAFWNVKFLLKTADLAVVLAKSIFRNLVD